LAGLEKKIMTRYASNMSGIQEIEQAIAKLPTNDFFRLREQVQRRFDEEWDVQFEKDVKAGKLDRIAAQAIAEHRAGRSTSFPPDAQ
jgi:hypothetical protein